jgi:integrase
VAVTVYDMRVAVTDYFSALSVERLVPGLDTIATLRSAGVPDGQPFIVASNGTYEAELNRVLRLMPSYGVRSVRSVRTYADVYVAVARFLHEQPEPKTIWAATREDFNLLYNCRRVDLATRQSKATWNLWVAALDKLYQIGMDDGLVAANPFPRGLRSVRGRYGPAMERNLAYEADGGQRPVKYLSLDQYRQWRNVGLLGTSAPLPRLRERNAAFADLLLATALRLQEAACLLTVEIGDEAIGAHRFDLGAATAKGSKTRRVSIPAQVQGELRSYMKVERAGAVAIGRRMGTYTGTRWQKVVTAGPAGVHLATGRAGRLYLHELAPRERARLLLVDDDGRPVGPLALWLDERGRTVSLDAWQRVFDRASQRAGDERAMSVHPHMLRHSFAVHMLGLLVQRVVNVALPDGLAGIRPDTALYTRVITDPVRQLQRLLGHATSQSTEVYLSCLDLAQRIVDGAVADLDATLPLDEYELPA